MIKCGNWWSAPHRVRRRACSSRWATRDRALPRKIASGYSSPSTLPSPAESGSASRYAAPSSNPMQGDCGWTRISLAAPFLDSHFQRTTKPKFSAPNNRAIFIVLGWPVTSVSWVRRLRTDTGVSTYEPLAQWKPTCASWCDPARLVSLYRVHPRVPVIVAEGVVMKKAPGSNRRRLLGSCSGNRCRKPTTSWHLVNEVIYLLSQTASKRPTH